MYLSSISIIHINNLHQSSISISIIYMYNLHQLSTSIILHQSSLSIIYINNLYQSSTSIIYINHLFQLYLTIIYVNNLYQSSVSIICIYHLSYFNLDYCTKAKSSSAVDSVQRRPIMTRVHLLLWVILLVRLVMMMLTRCW